MGEANEAANNYAKRQIELKELEVESKKDRAKDIHVSTKHMLKMICNRARQIRRTV
jgi:hypothetical protein